MHYSARASLADKAGHSIVREQVAPARQPAQIRTFRNVSDLAEAKQVTQTAASRRLYVKFVAALNLASGRKEPLTSILEHLIAGLALAG